jgi:uncharacterized protein
MLKLLVMYLLLTAPCWAQPALDGDWVGGWQRQREWVSVKVNFKTEAGAAKATLDVQAVEGPKTFTVAVVKLDQQTFRLETTNDATAIVLEGKLAGDVISGDWRQASAQGAFELLRVAKVDAKLFDQYVGCYQLSEDNFIAIGRQSRTGQNPRLGYVERKSGRRGNLTPISETIFIGGPALGLDYPADVRITFVKNQRGEVEGLQWRRGAAAEQFAKTLKLKEEHVTFPNDAHMLAGTLVAPTTKGPHPAIVLAHGSTPLHRYYFSADPYMFPANGVAVLFYDKRGVGDSTGARTEVISELASDLLAGVTYLKTRAEIDPKQIGLFGHSEGGWVVPEAAAHSKDVAFLIAGAASGLPRQENIIYEIDGDLRWAGFTEAERAQAKRLWRLRNDAVRTNGESWNAWRAEALKAKEEKWFSRARMPNTISEMNDANRGRLLNFIADERRWWYDPVPAWERVTIPALVYESEWDKDVPGKQSAAIIERALQKAGNKHYTIKVFPKSQHGQWAMETENPNNPLAYRVHYDALFDWLRQQIRLAK